MVGRAQCDLSEELLFIFPVINFVSSPSTSVKEAATDLLFMLEKVLVNFAIAPKEEPSLQGGFPSISRPASIIFRLLQQLWFQVYFFLFFISILKIVWFEVLNGFLKFLLPLLKLCGYLSAYSGNGDVFAPRHGFHMDKVVYRSSIWRMLRSCYGWYLLYSWGLSLNGFNISDLFLSVLFFRINLYHPVLSF